MLKLIKYDLRRHFLPFSVCIVKNLVLLFMGFIGAASEKAIGIFDDIYGIINLVLIIYACKEIDSDFCSDANLLGLAIPVNIVKRFPGLYNICWKIKKFEK